MKSRRVLLYDTTLRDGAQGEGVSFSGSGKLQFARRLDAFGIDYIEGGFAGSNPKDMEFFREILKIELSHAKIAAFGATRRARTPVKEDAFVRSLIETGARVATVVGKSWDFHVREVLRTTLDENLAMVSDTVRYLKDRGREVIFDAEHFFDGYHDNPEHAMRVLEAAAAAGADALVLCDTNGGALTADLYAATAAVVGCFPRVQVGIHAHNDMDLAVANSLEAVRAGACHVQGTINGYGERCGNANLVSIAPALELKMGCRCVGPRNLRQLREVAVFVHNLVNWRPDPRQPYVGHSAFSHKSGQHVNAVQKNRRTVEHIQPEAVGNERHILMSELSGGSSVVMKAIELGAGSTARSPKEVREILGALKHLEARGYSFEAADASFRMLIQKVLKKHRSFFDLEGFRVIVEKRGKSDRCLSEATVKVRVKDQIEHTVAEGDGPVNALDGALRKALIRFYPEIAKVALTDFRVRILDPEEATAATTRVVIESSDGQETWGTVGVSENIIEASWEALVDSVEYKLFRMEEQQRKPVARRGRRRPDK